jgi:hypothetical protein
MVVCLLLLMPVSAFASDATPVATRQGDTSAATGYAERDGAAEAKQDIATGHPKLKTLGLPAPWINEYAKLLKERLGIELERIAGCVVNQDLLTYSRAYNSVIQEGAEKKYGRNIFDQLRQEANQFFVARSPQTNE